MTVIRAGRPIRNAMTVDVEDYFQVSAFDRVVSRDGWCHFESRVEANTERLMTIFDETNVRATFFVLGWVAERCRGLVKRIAAAGHEVASHGYGHQLVYAQTQQEFRDDVRRAKSTLEDAGGVGVAGYRAPSYSITRASLWALDVLAEEGYAYDASVFPIRHDRYGIPDAPRQAFLTPAAGALLLELPPSTARLGPVNLPVSGGGYFRLLPYGWTSWGIRRVNEQERRPVIFYLHPWEVDPGQPRIQAGWLSRLRHYRNLAETEPRLRRLLGEFSFGPIREVFGDLLGPGGSGTLPVVDLRDRGTA